MQLFQQFQICKWLVELLKKGHIHMDACTHIHTELKALFIKKLLQEFTLSESQTCWVKGLDLKNRITGTFCQNAEFCIKHSWKPVLEIKIMHFSCQRIYFCLSLCFHLHTSSFSCSNLKLCKLNLLGTWFNSEKLPWDKYWLFTKKFTSVLTVSALSQ